MKHKNHPTIFSRAALMLLLMLMTTTTAWAEEFDYTDENSIVWSCTIIESTTNVSIVPKDKSSLPVSVTIPSSVTDNSTDYTVTTIGQSAFSYCSGLTSITIPGSVTTISGDAFQGCTGLQSITIPASVTSIGDYAFVSCSNLSSVTFANGSVLQSIGDIAFASTNLSSLSIPASVTSIGEFAFSSCYNLATITVAAENTVFNSPEGSNAIIETTSKKLIVGCKGTTIPNGVEIIGDYAFNDCIGLQSITIPASVKTISGGAFSGCSSLTSIIIPESVTSIGDYAFSWCTGLTSITIPESVTSIGGYAFDGCSSLTSITLNSNPVISSSALPNNVTVTMNLTANNVGSDYWMTFYNDGYNFQADANTTVYKAKISGSNLSLTAVSDGIVTAGNAVILKSTGNPVMTRVSGNSSDTHDNDLQGVMEETATPANCYTLANGSAGVGFYKYSGTKIGIGKAYLIYSGSAARTFYSFSDDATAIESIDNGPLEPNVQSSIFNVQSAPWFTLDGRRLSGQPTTKGIYVRNGQKFIIK